MELRRVEPGTAFVGELVDAKGLPHVASGFGFTLHGRGLFVRANDSPIRRRLSPSGGYYTYTPPPANRASDALINVVCLQAYGQDGWTDVTLAAVPGVVPFGCVLQLRGDTIIKDYQGPLDLRVKVRGFSPRRGAKKETHAVVSEWRDRKWDKGPRAIHLREAEDETEDEGELV